MLWQPLEKRSIWEAQEKFCSFWGLTAPEHCVNIALAHFNAFKQQSELPVKRRKLMENEELLDQRERAQLE